jgi:hypothetical protein
MRQQKRESIIARVRKWRHGSRYEGNCASGPASTHRVVHRYDGRAVDNHILRFSTAAKPAAPLSSERPSISAVTPLAGIGRAK